MTAEGQREVNKQLSQKLCCSSKSIKQSCKHVRPRPPRVIPFNNISTIGGKSQSVINKWFHSLTLVKSIYIHLQTFIFFPQFQWSHKTTVERPDITLSPLFTAPLLLKLMLHSTWAEPTPGWGCGH